MEKHLTNVAIQVPSFLAAVLQQTVALARRAVGGIFRVDSAQSEATNSLGVS